jgi:murein DD-endopeptidase MepM/ murein hydrolase activator NlpD
VLLGLIYTTKPDSTQARITLTRQGDTSTVIDTSKIHATGTSSDTVSFVPADVSSYETPPTTVGPAPTNPAPAAPAAPGAAPLRAGGSSFPVVTAADLTALRAHRLIIPAQGVTPDKLIDSFDDLRGGTRRHEALDIMSPRGTPVLSADDGQVLKLHNSAAGGNTIYVADTSQRYIMLYAHLDRYRTGLAAGMKVKKGEVIGFVGSTGNASPAAPHLHFAIARSDNMRDWWKGTPLNPFLIWRGK